MKKFVKLFACVLALTLVVAFLANASGIAKPLGNKKLPVKGDLITLDSKKYRVLKINGSVAV